MKLATIRDGGSTRAVRVDGDVLTDLGSSDLGEFLARPDWREQAEAAQGDTYRLEDVTFAPIVPNPSKVVCVGLNYKSHIEEMGRPLPEYPTLFSKFADTLVGATDDISRPAETEAFDWEAELTVVIGADARRVTGADAEAAIAGFTVMNDITCRDWQFRTREWMQGKNWDSSTPVGPIMVTPDELPGGVRPDLVIRCEVDGEEMQASRTSDLLFDPVDLVEYVSTMVRLRPGDLIATGTPGGVGNAREPKVFLHDGQSVVCEVEGIGKVSNTVVDG